MPPKTQKEGRREKRKERKGRKRLRQGEQKKLSDTQRCQNVLFGNLPQVLAVEIFKFLGPELILSVVFCVCKSFIRFYFSSPSPSLSLSPSPRKLIFKWVGRTQRAPTIRRIRKICQMLPGFLPSHLVLSVGERGKAKENSQFLSLVEHLHLVNCRWSAPENSRQCLSYIQRKRLKSLTLSFDFCAFSSEWKDVVGVADLPLTSLRTWISLEHRQQLLLMDFLESVSATLTELELCCSTLGTSGTEQPSDLKWPGPPPKLKLQKLSTSIFFPTLFTPSLTFLEIRYRETLEFAWDWNLVASQSPKISFLAVRGPLLLRRPLLLFPSSPSVAPFSELTELRLSDAWGGPKELELFVTLPLRRISLRALKDDDMPLVWNLLLAHFPVEELTIEGYFSETLLHQQVQNMILNAHRLDRRPTARETLKVFTSLASFFALGGETIQTMCSYFTNLKLFQLNQVPTTQLPLGIRCVVSSFPDDNGW